MHAFDQILVDHISALKICYHTQGVMKLFHQLSRTKKVEEETEEETEILMDRKNSVRRIFGSMRSNKQSQK